MFPFRNNDSFAAQRVTVPNAITSWVTDAFAVSQSTAMTIARPATLKVFKPFFVTINLPFSVIRGELAEITLTVFNYMQNDTTVRLLIHCVSDILPQNNFSGIRRTIGE